LNITFGHYYLKLPEVSTGMQAFLVRVEHTKLQDLPKAFLDYDTKYFDTKDNTVKHYYLDNLTEVLVLYFIHKGQLFTTIRPYTESKYEYYHSNIGNMFKVVIKE
jgi:hypothetical protein